VTVVPHRSSDDFAQLVGERSDGARLVEDLDCDERHESDTNGVARANARARRSTDDVSGGRSSRGRRGRRKARWVAGGGGSIAGSVSVALRSLVAPLLRRAPVLPDRASEV